MDRFDDTHVFRTERFSLGVDLNTKNFYLSIPVANRMVDYEEYYCLSPSQYQAFSGNLKLATAFADQCRARRHDDLLILKPGTDRGDPT